MRHHRPHPGPPSRRALPLALSLCLLAACSGVILDAGEDGSERETGERGEPLEPGREFRCEGDPEVADPGPAIPRRLTLTEYANTVRDTLDVDIAERAREQLPDDLRADGFSNNASALIVTLEHVQAYEQLAQLTVQMLGDPGALATEHGGCSELTDACAEAVVRGLGTLLLRAPVTAEERDALVPLFGIVREEGDDFDVAAGLVLEALLQSPRFLYRVEDQRGDGSPRPLGGWETASRLSYLLWQGPPDDALRSAARADRLRTDAQIRAQVDRMLADPRARTAAVEYFADWLDLERLRTMSRDPDRYPEWDRELALALEQETRRFIEEVVWEQRRPVTDLLNAQQTWVGPRLAAHYGLERGADAGDAVVEVDVSDVPERGGLLTQGSMLTIGGNRSSMVSRGKFLFETLLCGELDSPPPGVDTTPPEVVPGKSQRAYSEQRVDNEVCGGCHGQMEPISWGLERFDATGAYRLEDDFGNALMQDGWIEDPTHAGRQHYTNVAELMDLLAGSNRVRDCMSLSAAQYALGRTLVESDGCSLAGMRERFVASERTYHDLMRAIALSPAFRFVRTEE